jgi:hypothetical protein
MNPICGNCDNPKRKVGRGFRCDTCAAPPAPPDFSQEAIRRFWSKVDKTPGQGPQGECWEWAAGRDRDGYGQFAGKKWALRAHRYSWLLAHPGEVLTTADHAAHTCDNPPCVRSDHLFKTTTQGNNQDKMEKGRHRGESPGEDHHNAKITEDDVREIRRRYAAGGVSQSALGAEYGLCQSHIKDIVNFQRWKHVA